ncbi:MAG: hypothetical protein V3R20_02450 [Sphingomonadales bacterium]
MNNLVSSDWLAEHLGDENLVVLDASWYLPGDGPDTKAFFLVTHIPGARFLDIYEICDTDSALPHMLPSDTVFS